jgi:hypothetical protein
MITKNYLFKVTINEDGFLELRTADLSEKSFRILRNMMFKAKRICIDTSSGYLGTSLCTTVDDSYEHTSLRRDKE